MKLKDIDKRLANARELCPGMSDNMYKLTDYLSTVINKDVVPDGVLLVSILVLNDLKEGISGFNRKKIEYTENERYAMIEQIAFIPQVIDAIAPKEFAEEFRILTANYPELFSDSRRVETSRMDETYSVPEYVSIAVEWWANAIQSPSLDNGAVNPVVMLLASTSATSFDEKQLLTFKRLLSLGIMKSIEEYGSCCLDVDYHPCRLLREAGDAIGVPDMTGYPWKTTMDISENRVTVRSGYGSERKTLYTKEDSIGTK